MESRYYHHDNHLKRHRYAKRARWFAWGVFIAILLIVIAIVVYLLFFVKAETPSATSTPTTTVITTPIAIFKSPYFQFQTSEGWEEVVTEESNRFFYRLRKDAINIHDLEIIVDPSTQQINRLASSRVQVVNPNEGLLRPIGGISDACELVDKNLVDNDTVTMNDTTFTCTTGSALFDVAVSQLNGTPVLNIERANGEMLRLIMYYRDLRATPDGSELSEIVHSFQVI